MMELLLTTNRVEVSDDGGHCAVDNLNVIEHLCGSHITSTLTCIAVVVCVVAVNGVPDLLVVGRGQLFFCCSFAEILNSAIKCGDWQFQLEINRK